MPAHEKKPALQMNDFFISYHLNRCLPALCCSWPSFGKKEKNLHTFQIRNFTRHFDVTSKICWCV